MCCFPPDNLLIKPADNASDSSNHSSNSLNGPPLLCCAWWRDVNNHSANSEATQWRDDQAHSFVAERSSSRSGRAGSGMRANQNSTIPPVQRTGPVTIRL